VVADVAADEEVFGRRFMKRRPEIVAALSPVVDDIPLERRQWVFYGSRPLGAESADSDLDAILLHDGDSFPPHRRSATWDSTPVTIYVLTRSDLEADGEARRFGGYFALKLFRPFASDRPHQDADLHAVTANFLGPFTEAAAGPSPPGGWNADQLVAHAHLAFLDLYPDAAAYLAQLRRDPRCSRVSGSISAPSMSGRSRRPATSRRPAPDGGGTQGAERSLT